MYPTAPMTRLARATVRHSRRSDTNAAAATVSAPAANAMPQKTFNPWQRPHGNTSLRFVVDPIPKTAPRKLAIAPAVVSSKIIHRHTLICIRPA